MHRENSAWYKLFALFLVLALTLPILTVCGGGDGDDTLPDVRVLESKTQKIDSSGGSITLQDGTSVVFPAGAVDSATKVTISKIDPAAFFDGAGVERIVIRCTAPVTQFNTDVEIRVRLPQGITEADSPGVFSGILDEATGVVTSETSAIETIEGKSTLVIATNHFSTRVIWVMSNWRNWPKSKTFDYIPYYSQGVTEFCWAACLQMVSQAAKFDTDNEVFDIAGQMGIDASGLNPWSLGPVGGYGEKIVALMEKRTGLRPEQCYWRYWDLDKCLLYLKGEIALGNPVILMSNTKTSGEHQLGSIREHAVVVVGYDEYNNLKVHDPEYLVLEGSSGVGYTSREWDSLISDMDQRELLATLAVPKNGLDPNLPEVTVNIANLALTFMKPSEGVPVSYPFVWDYTNQLGYSFVDENTKGKVEALPGTVKMLNRSGTIEIVNSSRNINKAVSLLLEVSRKLGALETEEASYSYRQDLLIATNALHLLKLPQINDMIPVDEFRDNNQTPTWYYLRISAYDGDKLEDKATVVFTIDTEEIKIDSISPDKGSIGSQVTISGTGFGTVRGRTDLNTVILNQDVAATDVVSWEEKKIVVKVPNGATTGPVVIRRGTVESNKDKVFTITQEAISTGNITATRWADSPDVQLEAEGTWELTGIEPRIDYNAETYWILCIKKGSRARLTISVEATLDKYVVQEFSADRSYTITTYYEPELVPLTLDWTLRQEGINVLDSSSTEAQLTVDFAFGSYNQSVDIDVVFHVRKDIEWYSKEGVLITKAENVMPADVYVASFFIEPDL